MPKRVSKFSQTQQPVHWTRAILSGAISALFMLAFIDNFYLMGITPFSFELFLGAMIRGTQYGPRNWLVGFPATLAVGALFGILYAYCFEYVFKGTNPRLGMKLGLWHALFAAVAVFPFFFAIHEFMGTGLYPHFGILGSGLGAPTVILLITAHLCFGASMGLFYGDVQLERARNMYYESGETGVPVHHGGQSEEEDPEDSPTIIYRGG